METCLGAVFLLPEGYLRSSAFARSDSPVDELDLPSPQGIGANLMIFRVTH